MIEDGERGILGAAAKPFFDRRGIVVCVRAPGQRARIIERRGAILRRAMRCVQETVSAWKTRSQHARPTV
eukprot:2331139-Pyramimonas_sp.AAC.1